MKDELGLRLSYDDEEGRPRSSGNISDSSSDSFTVQQSPLRIPASLASQPHPSELIIRGAPQLSDKHRVPCRNCGQFHLRVVGTHSQDCSLILHHARSPETPKPTGRKQLHGHGPFETYLIPENIRQQATLFDEVWFDFVDKKHANEAVRDKLSMSRNFRGPLKDRAPLLWMRWRGADGSFGQTRSQENYEKIWRELLVKANGNGQKVPVAWVTVEKGSRVDSPPESPIAIRSPPLQSAV